VCRGRGSGNDSRFAQRRAVRRRVYNVLPEATARELPRTRLT